MDPIVAFLAAAIRIGTPLAWAALGETLAERAGVINLSVEGSMLSGCLAAAAVSGVTGDPWLGLVAGVAAGALVAALFALLAVGARTDQIIAGTALTLAAVGLTGLAFRRLVAMPSSGLQGSVTTLPWPAATTIAVIAAGLGVWWYLSRTTGGLRLRAVGESAEAARAAGVPARRVQAAAVIVGGAMAGMGGATLVLAQVGTFAERMTAGRGFIAIAIVVLGRWRPLGVLVAALGFGAANALQFAFQAMGLDVPYQFFLMLPYLLAVAALTGLGGRLRAPAGLGKTIG
ncbi:MAG: ABC transporter permease [Gemmatimonadales bacterium]